MNLFINDKEFILITDFTCIPSARQWSTLMYVNTWE